MLVLSLVALGVPLFAQGFHASGLLLLLASALHGLAATEIGKPIFWPVTFECSRNHANDLS